MPTQVQFRRGTTSQNDNFTGAVGELSVDTDLNVLRVHDGSTQGGFALSTESDVDDRMQVANVNSLIATVNTNLGQKLGATASVTLTGDVTGSGSFSSNAVSIALTDTNLGNTNAYIASVASDLDTQEAKQASDLANTNAYIATVDSNHLDLSGGTMTGAIAMGTSKITGLGDPTQAQDAATKNYVDTEITSLVDSAPSTLDTLNELAAALGDDANFATTVTTNLGQKLGATATVAITGAVAGDATAFSSNSVSIAVTQQNNSVTLGTHTTGDYVGTITGGTGIASTGATSGEGVAHTLSVDLSELTDMTQTMVGSDEFIVLDAGADRRKAASEIGLSIFNNDSGFSTTTGTVTSHTVGAGDGLTGGGTVTSSGTTTVNVGAGTLIDVTADAVNVDLSELTTSTSDGDGDFFVVVDDANAQKKLTKGNINISGFNNDAGFSTTTGTVTSVNLTAGNLIDVSGGPVTSSGSITVNVDLSELTDGTADIVGAEDELVYLDNGSQKRKLVSEIAIGQFNTTNQIALGTDTTGNYIATISGTANEVEVSGSGSETAGVTIGLPNDVTLGGDLTVSGGDIVLGGTGRIQGIDTVSSGTDAANKSYVDTEVAGIVNSAPAALDTLNELAAALGDDANFATTVSTNLGQKLGATATVTLTGDVTASATAFSSNAVSISTDIASNVVGAAELKVTGNGSVDQYLASDGDGTFTFKDIPAGYTDSDVDDHLSGGTGIAYSSGTISVDLSELTDMTQTMVGTDEFIVLDAGADRRKAASEIGLSIFNNDANFSTTTGTVTSVNLTAGNLIDVSGGPVTSSGSITVNVDLSELTDMTAGMVSTDEFVLLDNGAQRRKAANEIKLDVFGGNTWETKTANFNVAKNGHYFADVRSTAIVATLPSSPSSGDEFRIVVIGDALTNNLKLSRNGQRIQGELSNLVVTTANAGFGLVYSSANTGWRLLEV